MHRLALLLLLPLGACAQPSSIPGAADLASRPPDLDAAADLAQACRDDKMAFTQQDGCRNDGSVEFCAPAADAELLAAVQRIAPQARCARGGGRARCDLDAELLCFFPTGEAECLARHGALKDAAWAQLCQLAALPQIRRIVPTWFE
jgi:hypothetical protein